MDYEKYIKTPKRMTFVERKKRNFNQKNRISRNFQEKIPDKS